MSYIQIECIQKTFDGKRVLDDISIDIEQGEFTTLLGPSGCGKTTLLRCLAGLENIDGGRIFIDGRDMTNALPKERKISMIFQQYSLFPTMTVYKNVAFGLKMRKMNKAEIHERVLDALTMADIVGLADKYPSQLSGGEQQRVALARSIVTESKVLLLDEPFSAIDAKLRKALQINIKEIHEDLGMTTVFVTHDQEEAMRLSDRIYLMHDGKMEQTGPPMALYMNPATTFAAGFMGHCNLLTREAFEKITASGPVKDGYYAIRPENIRMRPASAAFNNPDDYVLTGTIKRVIPQGNLVRYTVMIRDYLLDVDRLFEANDRYEKNDAVSLSIDRDLIIFYGSS